MMWRAVPIDAIGLRDAKSQTAGDLYLYLHLS